MATLMSRAGPILVVLVSACGSEPPESLGLTLSVPWLADAAISGCSPAELGGMTATIYIAEGFPPCVLQVNADRSVSGRCPAITTGRVRPLLLAYAFPAPPTARMVGLAFGVSSVDLTFESLPAGDAVPVVQVDLTANDIYVTPARFDALAPPGRYCDIIDVGDADAWAWCRVQDLGLGLDCDNDGLANLDELCNGANLACP